jgi:hypothetical protein
MTSLRFLILATAVLAFLMLSWMSPVQGQVTTTGLIQDLNADLGVTAAPAAKPGDGPQGVIESDPFIVPTLGMLLVEAAGNGGMLELIDAGTGDTLLTITPGLTSTTLGEFDTDISQFAGTEAFLRITDNSSGGWGHIAVDNLTITGFEFVAVPEPTSLAAFLLVGLVGLAMGCRQYRRRRSA